MIKKILIILSILLVIGLLWGCESTYTRQAEVVSIKGESVYCEDTQGHIWEYKGSASVGDTITLIMSDNHTDHITDDIVKGVK